MGWAKANIWCTEEARDLADAIARINYLYCGPAVVGWIAAVWNKQVKGRAYDYKGRLQDKKLFPDGPRKFFGKPEKFQRSLNDILLRETEGELGFSKDMLHKYGTIHDRLEQHDMPIVICLCPDDFVLHYVTLYKSQKDVVNGGLDRIKFFWQDNGLYGGENDGNPGLYRTGWRSVGESAFTWGAGRVIRT